MENKVKEAQDLLQRQAADLQERIKKHRPWYIGLGVLLLIFSFILLGSLPFATLTAVYLFGSLMILGGILHAIAAFKFFSGGRFVMWTLIAVLYIVAGILVFKNPLTAAAFLTYFLAAAMSIMGLIRIFASFSIKPAKGWGWILFSGILSVVTGILIFSSAFSVFWVLGLFLALDMMFQGINYLSIASLINK